MLTALLLPVRALAQDPSQSGKGQAIAFKIRSNAVIVDLIAVDDQGRFVTDLKADEIELKEDGKKQDIRYLELVGSPDEAGESSGAAASAPPVTAPAPAAAEEAASIALVIDVGSVDPPSLGFVSRAISSYLLESQFAENSRFMLATVGGGVQIIHPFTGDVEAVTSSLQRVRPSNIAGQLSFTNFLEEIEPLFTGLRTPGRSLRDHLEVAAQAVTEGNGYLEVLAGQVQRTSKSIELLSRHLQQLPGRKQMVLFTSGYPLGGHNVIRDVLQRRIDASFELGRPTGDTAAQISAVLSRLRRVDTTSPINEAIDQANRSQVSIYAVDARGLLTGVRDSREMTGSGGTISSIRGDQVNLAHRNIAVPQDFLVALADATGGLTFMNQNDLESGIDAAYRDSQRYYLLSYEPSKKKGKTEFRRINVKVKRPGLSLRYREGYVFKSDEELRQEQVYEALAHPHLFKTFDIAVEVTPKDGKLEVLTGVPTSALVFSQEGDRFHCAVEIFGVLVDEQGKWATEKLTFAKKIDLKQSAQELQQFRQTRYAGVQEMVKVKPGNYTLIVVVRQGPYGQMTSLTRPVQMGG